MANLDHAAAKQQQRDNWEAAAEGWRRRDALLRKGAAPVTKRMLELAQIGPGAKVLDIASGTGEPAISAAIIAGLNGKVVGIDLASAMLSVAREKAAAEALSTIEFHQLDAETMDFAAGSFDAVTMRWGLMFMPRPLACLLPARKALKDQGRICLACWAAPDKNPFVSLLMQTLANYMDLPEQTPGTPGIFAFADPDRLHDVLDKAGFHNIALEEMALDVMQVADGRAYWEAMEDLAAPVMALVNQLDETARARYVAEVIAAADSYKTDDGVTLGGTTWIAAADK